MKKLEKLFSISGGMLCDENYEKQGMEYLKQSDELDKEYNKVLKEVNGDLNHEKLDSLNEKYVDLLRSWNKEEAIEMKLINEVFEIAKQYNNLSEEEKMKKKDELWKEHDLKIKEYRDKIAKEFYEKNQGKFVYTYEYSDHDENGGRIDHGFVFKKLAHIRFNNH